MIFRLLLIAMIMTSCGFEGEFDFAITEGGEHGQTKSVATPHIKIPSYNPPDNEALEDEPEQVEEAAEFNIQNYVGSYTWKYGIASVSIDETMMMTVSYAGSASDEITDLDINELEEMSELMGDHVHTGPGLYSEELDATLIFNTDDQDNLRVFIFFWESSTTLEMTAN